MTCCSKRRRTGFKFNFKVWSFSKPLWPFGGEEELTSMLESIIDYCNDALEQLKDEEGNPLRSNDQIATMLELYECIWDVRKMFDMSNYIPVPVLYIQPI